MVAARRSGQSGFTLLELLVVVAVLGVLSGVAVVATGALGDRSQEVACSADAATLRTAQQASQVTNGAFGDESALVDRGLLQRPSEYHDVVIEGDSYRLVGVGGCAEVSGGPVEVAAGDPGGDTPPGEPAAVAPPGAGTPDAGTPGADTPGADTPDADTPSATAPATAAPGKDAPGKDAPAPQAQAEVPPAAENADERRCAGRVDLNTATPQQLEKIIHVGPARAELIVAARPFRSVDQLVEIRGLGPVRLADIVRQGVVCV